MRVTGLSILLFITLAGLNCKKDSNNNPTPDVPGIITITTPVAGTIYDNGFSLRTEGEMSDDNGLGSAKVEVRNKTTGAILFQQTSTPGNVTFYRFTWNWTVAGITAPITATVKVTAIDKQSNQVFKEVDVTLSN
jgi:hypothetical protein